MAVSTPSMTAHVQPRSRFYFRMALVMTATGVLGFVPTFWLPMSRGAFTSPVITIHALASSAWLLLFTCQTWLAASGRVARHRDLGLVGVSLATAIVIFGLMAAVNQAQRASAAGHLERGLQFMVLPVWQVLLLATFFTAAFATRRKPEWHKRLLLFATAEMMSAPLNRLFVYFVIFHRQMPVPAGMPSPPPPVDAGHPVGLLADAALFYLPMVHDWRTRGRVHPAYVIGYASILSMRLLRPVVSRTAAWHAVAARLLSLAGG